MKLADLRKLAIRKQIRICFPLKNGMECVITERGVAQVPALKALPDFNLEEELSGVSAFVMEPVAAPGSRSSSPRTTVRREALAGMVAEGSAMAQTPDDHEDD
jgi:hypothetical protein